MAHKKTAGLLLYRIRDSMLEVFLVHPGGPFWAKKDEGAWSIPKGEFAEDEQPLSAAKREFREETGFSIEGNFMALAPLKQRSGKLVYAWALEVDWASWFTLESAKRKIVPGQIGFLEELQQILSRDVLTS